MQIQTDIKAFFKREALEMEVCFSHGSQTLSRQANLVKAFSLTHIFIAYYFRFNVRFSILLVDIQ